jgi:hypothetical protein
MTSPYFYLRILSSLGRSRASFWAIGCKNETVTRLPKRIGTSRSAARLGWPRDRVAELPCCDRCATLARAMVSTSVTAAKSSPLAHRRYVFRGSGSTQFSLLRCGRKALESQFQLPYRDPPHAGTPLSRRRQPTGRGGDCLPPLVSQDWKRSKSRQCHGQDYVYSARRNRTRRRG